MMHPDTELRFINEKVGYGVVATKFIPEGTITWVQDDLDHVFYTSQVEKLHPKSAQMLEKYAFRNRFGDLVLCWDLAKYVNHSFNSNCFSTAYGFEIAVRDIQVGEELT
ncbi:MAG: SET domain-containing protein, partial [Salegentibacter mishustinae]|nr:SET domain-containing protein [Salegentibacter mishustinae]